MSVAREKADDRVSSPVGPSSNKLGRRGKRTARCGTGKGYMR